MRIEIKDQHGKPRFSVHADPASPPTVVKASDGRGPAVSLDWDQALDDEGNLRHCPVCGCPDFYVKKNVPQLTVFALIVAAALIAMVFYGFGLSTPALIVLGIVLGFDLLIYLYAERYLVCYRCQSTFHQVPILPTDKPWDSNLAERYPRPKIRIPLPGSPTEPGAGTDAEAKADSSDDPTRSPA